jgi:sigma-B regulation protein RsbQ
MWRWVAPAFEARNRVVLFDHIGCGRSDAGAYDPGAYSELDGYASDVIEIADALELGPMVFVGHSVSAMMGVLASVRRPDLFAGLVLIGPSPRYIDDPTAGYVGGFEAADIEGLLTSLESNYLGWSQAMAPVIMAHADRPELAAELAASFCRIDPAIARRFARVTFLSDNRGDLAAVPVPVLVVQCRDDAIAPVEVGEYVHRAIPDSEFELIDTAGHCPHLTEPDATVDALRRFLDRLGHQE